MKTLGTLLLGLASLLLLAVLASLLPTDYWLVRTVDLVREPLIYLATGLLLLALFLDTRWRGATIALLGVSILVNLARMWPYLAIAGTEVALDEEAAATPGARCFSAMSVNVKVKNEDYDRIAAQVARIDPDILFLMETDARWVEQLRPLLSSYDHVEAHPQPEAFGLVFATRLPVAKTNIIENTHRDTPTLYATLAPEGGAPFEFIGLHPKPPLPGWNTELRDENIVNAATQTPDRLPDAIVMGDFNDVPWSRTTSKFREVGDWRDPRVGRGAYPTFPADLLWLGWPLDQLMVKGDLELTGFEVLPDNGSDHRALLGRFCRPAATPAAGAR
ncbi:endonuclease/exonuclease/phosphatase family protein [Sphingomicrobium astaxanthinifaciens]|uniref:endonuclease/exonuclease/phosphatase family protein n=1 Tax=Sphingomicrobium astaxanthinifaciens TaxID=1227949 RepID=UPI001FCABE97|nr:endonuclease/exonuclease/phosphatase family protein [Sphingomicrobium astaxanthinifaciens]MCJ7420722.1 endonuclease/exonuclease/phosphatase family protein [Sphingomicrobium astaxanthinifaciens]